MKKMIFRSGVLLAALLSSLALAEEAPVKPLRLQVGLEHWFSDSFRSAEQAKVFGVGANYRLPFSSESLSDTWLEIAARYEWATIKAEPTQPEFGEFNGRRMNFYTLGPAVAKDFRVGEQTVTLSVIPFGFVFAKPGGHQTSVGIASGFTIDWLFSKEQQIGMFLDVRENNYRLKRLDGSETDVQVDFSSVLGVVVRL